MSRMSIFPMREEGERGKKDSWERWRGWENSSVCTKLSFIHCWRPSAARLILGFWGQCDTHHLSLVSLSRLSDELDPSRRSDADDCTSSPRQMRPFSEMSFILRVYRSPIDLTNKSCRIYLPDISISFPHHSLLLWSEPLVHPSKQLASFWTTSPPF